MRDYVDLQDDQTTRARPKTLRLRAICVVIVACICGFGTAYSQSSDLGAYQGTIKVSGTEVDPQVSYSASVEISLPVTDRDDDSITAEFLSGEACAWRITNSSTISMS
jgi:hypothetical protein